MDDNRLGAILLEGGVVDEAGLERCLLIQSLTGGTRPIGQIVVEQGLLTAPDVQRLLDLQRVRATPQADIEKPSDIGSAALVAAAMGNRATELVVSEGRPARMRVGGAWHQLTDHVLGGPDVWDFVRETMGGDVLEILAEKHFVVRPFARQGLGQGSATAFRQFDGVAVRVTFPSNRSNANHVAAVHPAVADSVKSGRGLLLVAGDRGLGRADALAPLIRLAAAEANHYVVVVDDEPVELPTGGALVVRRRYGLDAAERASALRSVVREDPDTLVIADVGNPETFELALRAAEGGRLVIGFLAATTATAALTRVLNFYPSYDLPRVKSTLAAVLRSVSVHHELPDADRTGTVVATELLLVDEPVREVIRTGDLADLALLIRAEGSKCGYSLDRDMLELLAAGRVRVEDVFARAEEKARVLERTRNLPTNPK